MQRVVFLRLFQISGQALPGALTPSSTLATAVSAAETGRKVTRILELRTWSQDDADNDLISDAYVNYRKRDGEPYDGGHYLAVKCNSGANCAKIYAQKVTGGNSAAAAIYDDAEETYTLNNKTHPSSGFSVMIRPILVQNR